MKWPVITWPFEKSVLCLFIDHESICLPYVSWLPLHENENGSNDINDCMCRIIESRSNTAP